MHQNAPNRIIKFKKCQGLYTQTPVHLTTNNNTLQLSGYNMASEGKALTTWLGGLVA